MAEHELKTTFLKIYANIPIRLRTDIIYVTQKKATKVGVPEGEPMTWNACWLEVRNNTEIGNQILDTLRALEII